MRHRPIFPWIVLAISLLMTVTATWVVSDGVKVQDKERLANAVQSTHNRIESRLSNYIALLSGGAGLFAASDAPITLNDFQEYTRRLDIRRRYPGIQGIGFSKRVLPENADSLVASLRAQGFLQFKIWPDSAEVESHAIVYLEPLDPRNQAAIGYNMFSESTRRDAMVRARDTGVPSISGKVTLVQEIEGRKQAGFLIYYPVYRAGTAPEQVTERREKLEGFVYAPFRADDLFSGIFRSAEYPLVSFKIYDGYTTDQEHLLHDSGTSGIFPDPSSPLTETSILETGGRTWTISFATTSLFEEESRHPVVPVVAVAGLLLSLALFALSRLQLLAEEVVRANERRLRMVLESLPVGVFVADRKGKITFSNSTSRRIWVGDDSRSVEDRNEPAEWWYGLNEQVRQHEWGLAQALQGEKVEGEIFDIKALDGSLKTILHSAFPIRNAANKVELAVAVSVDITEQRRTEAALRDREREFRTMVDSVPQLIWMADENGHIFWYNQRWFEFTGIDPDEMKETGWQQVQHPEYRERIASGIRRSFEAGEPWEETFPIRAKSGEYRLFLSQAVPIRDDSGKVIRWFGTSTNITEQMRAREAEARAIREQVAREAAESREEQLKLHASELERSNRELQDFAYVASHDLQEPLRKISTFADLVQEEYGTHLDDMGRLYLQRVQDAAIRMSRLIKDLLAFSRVTTRAQPFERIDLNVILSDVLSDLEVLLKATGGNIEVCRLPIIDAEPMQMRQLFQNLIGNALKFHRHGVSPLIKVRANEESGGLPGLGNKKVCRIEVEDNGIGFDEKYLDRIFTPFQRLHGSGTYEGTGIGLAICRRIVERHGGSITARSAPGKGSTFIVKLPVKKLSGVLV